MKYYLRLQGTFEIEVNANNEDEATEKAYITLSENIYDYIDVINFEKIS